MSSRLKMDLTAAAVAAPVMPCSLLCGGPVGGTGGVQRGSLAQKRRVQVSLAADVTQWQSQNGFMCPSVCMVWHGSKNGFMCPSVCLVWHGSRNGFMCPSLCMVWHGRNLTRCGLIKLQLDLGPMSCLASSFKLCTF